MINKPINILYELGLCALLISCSNNYYSIKDFNSSTKIDAHTHLNSTSSALTEQAIEDNFRILCVNTDVPEFPSLEKQSDYAHSQNKQFPNKVDFVTTFSMKNWNSPNWSVQTIDKLKSDFANGALGVKIWKNIGMTIRDSSNQFIMIDDPRFDPVIDYIIQQNKTILGHLGEPKNCWLPIDKMTVNSDKDYFKAHPEYHMYLHPDYPSYEDQVNARDRFLEHHPNLKFVGAHLGSLEWSVDELAKRLDKFPNMAVDLAERICHLQYQSIVDREKVRNFIIKYQDRLIYGSDFIMDSTKNTLTAKSDIHQLWLNEWLYFVTDEKMTVERVDGEFMGLKLPKRIVDKIFYKNAVRWYKMKTE